MGPNLGYCADTLVAAYDALLTSCAATATTPFSSYNLLLTRTWMLLVPRYHCEALGVSINSVGYAGLMMVKPGVTAEPLDVLIGCATP
jgi:ATP adenylyltransferase/5',5'''-P-1,P-4-tetraphosphate phosphorylase II